MHVLGTDGNYVFPANALTLVRIIAGTGAVCSPLPRWGCSVSAPSCARSAGAVTAGIVVFVLPNLLGPGVLGPGASGGALTWLYRFTPAAAFSVFGVLPRSSLVDFPYTLANDYYPLAPWAGLAVLCRLHRRRPRRGGVPAPAQRRMTEALLRRVDQAAHPHRQPPGCSSAPSPSPSQSAPRSLPPPTSRPGSGGEQDPTRARAHRRRPRPSRHRRARGAGHLRGVRHRHDPHHPRRHAPPPRPARSEGSQRGRPHPRRRGARPSPAACSPGDCCSPPPGSTPPTDTRSSRSPTAPRCAPRPAASSTSS